MADEVHATPSIAVASATPGAESGASQHKNNRRTRKPKPRGGEGAGDAEGAESKPSKLRERQPRGKPQQKPHGVETTDAEAAREGDGEAAAAPVVESAKERGGKKPREKSERKSKRETKDTVSEAAAPPPAPVDGAAAASPTREKQTAKPSRQPKNATPKGEEEPAGDVEAEVSVESVDWTTAAWFTGCDSDLGLSYWLLSRCLSCNDVQTLASEAAVRRAVQLNTLLGRLKTELLPADDEDPSAETRSEWVAREILSETVALLPSGDAKSGDARGVAVATLEGEVIDAATDLLLSRVGKDELALLQQWETHLEALIKPVEGKNDGSKTTDNDGDGDEEEKDDDEEEEEEEEAKGEKVEEADAPGGIEEAAAVLPPPRARKGKGGSSSSIAHAKAQVAAAISFHKAFEQRASSAAATSALSTSTSAVEQWTTEIHRIYESTRVVPSEESRRKGVAAQIESAFRRSPQWRRCEVLLFGSSLSKFGSKTSDLDLCLRANPGNDVEETAAMMSVRELRLRMRRTQHQELAGHGLPTRGDREDPAFLKETLDKSVKAVEALVNGMDKQRKKTKNKSAAKQKRLATLAAHWKSLVAVLEFYCKQHPEPTGAAPGSSKREAKAAAAAYHAALHKQQKKRQRDIYAAAALLGRNGCDVDLVVAHARIPVIGFTHRASGWECDLCFENYHACINTLLLRTYAEFDDRARALGIAVKHWAKQRGINDASTGHLSSYSFILLTIFFLQTKARILPNLQHPDLLRKANVVPMMLNGVDVSFCADQDQARAFHHAQHPEPSTQSVGELLLAFFQFYVDEFDFSELVSSVRHPERVQTKRARWSGKNKLKSWRISIEDPLEMDRDLGSVLQFRCQLLILEEMKRALGLLRDGESFETRVCEAVEGKKKPNKAEKKKQQQQQRRDGEKPKQNRNDGRGNKPNAKNGEDEKAPRGDRGGRRQDGPADGKNNTQQRQHEKTKPNGSEKTTVNCGPVRGRVEKQAPQTAPEDSWRRGSNPKAPGGDHGDKKLHGRGRRGDTRGGAGNATTAAPSKSEA